MIIKIFKCYNSFKLTFLTMLFCLNLSAQESWVIYDQDFNASFIEAYNEALFNLKEDPTDQEIISEDDQLVVDVENNIFDISSVGPPSKTLNKDVIDKIPQSLISKLKKRKYDWDHLDWKQYSNFEILGRNAYEYANFKEIRDNDWWIRNTLSLTPFANIYIARPEPDLFAYGAYQGLKEIGYPLALSKNARLFVATETAKIFLNIPLKKVKSFGYADEVHPIEMAYGGGLSFNIDNIGGMFGLNILDWADKLDFYDIHDPNNTIFNKWSSSIYWTRTQKFKIPVSGKNSKNHENNEAIIPDGVQTFKFGPAYTKLTYGQIDSVSGFNEYESTDWGDSFSILFEWTYLSDKVQPEGSYNYYHKWSARFRTYLLGVSKINFDLTYNFSSGFAIGLNAAWADDIVFLKGDQKEFTWKPGLVVTPTLTKRF